MNDFNPQQVQNIEKIIRDYMSRGDFKYPKVVPHFHDGVDAPHIKSKDVKPSPRLNTGSIEFASQAQYTIDIFPNSTCVWFYGVATHNGGSGIDIRAQIVGNALLGPSYYSGVGTTTNVPVAKQQQGSGYYNGLNSNQFAPAQSCSMFLIDDNGGVPANPVVRALASQTHIIDVEYGSVVARGTIIKYDNTSMVLNIETLSSGWKIDGNFVVT